MISFAFANSPSDFFSNISGSSVNRECWGWFYVNIRMLDKLGKNVYLFTGPHKFQVEDGSNPTFASSRYLTVYSETVGRFIYEHKEFFSLLAKELGVKVAFVDCGYKYPFLVGTFNQENYKFHHFLRNFWSNVGSSPKAMKVFFDKGYDTFLEEVMVNFGVGPYVAFSNKYIPDYMVNDPKYFDMLYSPEAAMFISNYMSQDPSYYNASMELQKQILLDWRF